MRADSVSARQPRRQRGQFRVRNCRKRIETAAAQIRRDRRSVTPESSVHVEAAGCQYKRKERTLGNHQYRMYTSEPMKRVSRSSGRHHTLEDAMHSVRRIPESSVSKGRMCRGTKVSGSQFKKGTKSKAPDVRQEYVYQNPYRYVLLRMGHPAFLSRSIRSTFQSVQDTSRLPTIIE